MKRKELKDIAKKIAQCELIIQNSNDQKSVQDAQMEIMKISSELEWSEYTIIDDMVQEILEKNT